MKIGLISDTHSYLDPGVFQYFEPCDEIWHAGDIGAFELLDQLELFRPTRAVFGNIDDNQIRGRTQENLIFELEKKKFLLTHIASKPPRYDPRIRNLIGKHQPDVIICGHSHFLRVEQDKVNNLLFLNPGAAGRHGFHQIRTLLRFNVENAIISNLEVIELGPRSAMKA